MKIPNYKIRLVLGGFLTAIASSFITTAQAVPSVWAAGNGHSYEVIRSAGINWNDANAAATAAGGYLATITSADEDAFVWGLVQAAQLGQVWGGGYQDAGENDPAGGWKWVTGECWTYSNWAPNEPNDNYGPGSEQHLGLNWQNLGHWNDEGNLNNLFGYVIEWGDYTKCVPDGGATALLMGASLMGFAFFRRK